MEIYTDGSYSSATEIVAWGFVHNGEGHSGIVTDPEACSMLNVAGELAAVMQAISYAIKRGASSVTIYHDYVGVAAWAKGTWMAKKPPVQAYLSFMDNISEKIEVSFVKVSSHANPADEIARKASGAGRKQ